jgi:hypothetical protein
MRSWDNIDRRALTPQSVNLILKRRRKQAVSIRHCFRRMDCGGLSD